MSPREGRGSETEIKRHNSRLDGEPSSKRSRRDGKPATERTLSSNHDLDNVGRTDQDQKHHRRLQDTLLPEASLEPGAKSGTDALNRELSKNTIGVDGTKPFSNPSDVLPLRSYFQHDERDSSGHGGRSYGRRAPYDHKTGSNTKNQSIDKDESDRRSRHSLPQRDDRISARGDNKTWRHDKFSELESDAPAPARKRPAFREKKIEPETENATAITANETAWPNRHDRPIYGNSRRNERGDRYRDLDRPERRLNGDRTLPHMIERESYRLRFPPRERFGTSNSGSRGRERFNGSHSEQNEYHRPSSFRSDKWKHDLYDEANKSPTQKNEEDQIAKVEALLAL